MGSDATGKRALATPYRVEKLKQIQFTFPEDNARAREAVWPTRVAELETFKERFGHCRVPYKWQENEPLANWVARLRRKWEKVPLDKQEQLLAMGFETQIRPPVNKAKHSIYNKV